MFSPYLPNSCYESDYECICIMITDKTYSVPLNILSSVVKQYMTIEFHGLYVKISLFVCVDDLQLSQQYSLISRRFPVQY